MRDDHARSRLKTWALAAACVAGGGLIGFAPAVLAGLGGGDDGPCGAIDFMLGNCRKKECPQQCGGTINCGRTKLTCCCRDADHNIVCRCVEFCTDNNNDPC